MNSLSARTTLVTLLVLTFFAALTALGLERAFRDSAEAARAERLQAQLFLLMGVAEVDAGGALTLPPRLPEARLMQPDSGLYARITIKDNATPWLSPSAIGRTLPEIAAGSNLARTSVNDEDYLGMALSVDWEVDGGARPITFQMIEDSSAFDAELARFRRSLWGWLAGAAVLLLIAQGFALRWGMRPLRAVAGELKTIESGERDALKGDYPSELQPLTDGLNALLRHERAQQSRYRDALGDLAHSLKTPLAVLHGMFSARDRSEADAQALEQLERMDRIVAYQLQRAATSGRSALAAPVAVAPLVKRLTNSLDKVYRDKGAKTEISLTDDIAFRGSEDDLMEMLGNLLDNAYKWCRTQVRVSGNNEGGKLRLMIEDDGPGIPPEQIPTILSRGGRLDETVPGQGIGLAVVRDIVNAYGGQIEIRRSTPGGAHITLMLPGVST